MVSRMKELEQLILKGRPKEVGPLRAFQQYMAGKGKLTPTEKRKLKALQRRARKMVDIQNNAPSVDITVSKKRTLPTGKGGTEPLFKKDGSPRLGSPKNKKPIRTKGSDEAIDRKEIKTANVKPKQRPTGRGSTTSLMPKTYTIKAGDTLSAIAKKMNTTVAILKAANNIKDANKIRKGQKIKIYRDANKTTTKPRDTRPRTVAQAQKMGKKYFFDKYNNRKAAVTAEQLKKSGLTLAQWLKKK